MNKLRKATEMLEIADAYHQDIEARIVKPFVDSILDDIVEQININANKGYYSAIFKWNFPKHTKEELKQEKGAIIKYLKNLLEEYGYAVDINNFSTVPVDICLCVEWGKDE